ncbi:hypothetical protein GGF31_002093 [Allomyces arbusculus]|nr:hypothetical protein GGF31_002093 [Allomyces arbusculus]
MSAPSTSSRSANMPAAPTPLPVLLPTTAAAPPTTTPGFESRRRRRPRFERIHADDRADPDALADRLALLWTKYVSDVLLHNYAVLPADVVQGLEAVEPVLRGSSTPGCHREEAIASLGGASSCCGASRLAHALHHDHRHADDHDDDLASTAAVWPTLRSPRPAALALGAHSVRLTRKPSTSSSRRAAAPPGTPRPLHRAASPALSAVPTRHPAPTDHPHLPAARICRASPAPRRSIVGGGIRDAAAVAGGARLARRGGDPAYHATLRLAQLRLKHLVAAIVAPLLVKLEHMDPASRPLLRILLARHRDQIPVLLLEPVARRMRRTSLLSATESVRSSTSSWSLDEDEEKEVMHVSATLDLAASPLEKLAVLLRHEMDTAARALHAALLGARLAAPPLQASYDLVVRSVRLFAYIQRADPTLKWVLSDPGTSVDARAMDTVTDPCDHARSAHQDAVVLFSVGPGLVREDETGAIVAVIRRERVVIGRRLPASCCGTSLSSTTSDSWVDDETDSELTWSDRSRSSSAAPSPAPSSSSPRLHRSIATPGSPGTLCLPSLRDTARTRPTSAPGGSPRLVLASLARIASVPSLRGGDVSGAQLLRHTQSTPAMAHRTSALVHLLRGEGASPVTSAFGLVSPPATPPQVGSPLRSGGASPQIAARHRRNPSNGSSLLAGAAFVPHEDEVGMAAPPRRQAKVSSVCAVLDMPLE